MNSEENIKLLEKCDSGIKMAAQSIEYVLPHSENQELSQVLKKYSQRHYEIGKRSENLLKENGEEPKKTGLIGQTVLKMNSSMKIMNDNSASNIADLMIDGCNNGIKFVSKYLNQYPGADAGSLDLAGNIIRIEQSFADELRQFL